MKVLVMGNKRMVGEIRSCLSRYGADSADCSEGIDAMAVASREKIDAAIISCATAEAGTICNYFRNCCGVPVAVATEKPDLDWRELEVLNADGFISLGMGQTELMARLQAIVRRSSLTSGTAGAGPGSSRRC